MQPELQNKSILGKDTMSYQSAADFDGGVRPAFVRLFELQLWLQ